VSASFNGATQSTSIGLTVPVQPGSLTCSPATVNAPGTSTCTVLLTGIAPTGGASIALSSNNVNIAVPASVAAVAGQNSASFTATVANVSSDQTGVLTASLNGASKATTLAVTAPTQISSLSCSPSSLNSNSTSTCTVGLSKVALSATVVTLSSSSAALQIPASVTVAVNQSSATFSATTAAVSAPQSVNVTASLNGLTQSTSIKLTVVPQSGSLSCSPATVSAPGTTTCTVTLTAIAPSGGVSVALTSNNTSVTVPATTRVPAGASSASFTARATAVTAAQSASLTASAGGGAPSFLLSVTIPTWSVSGLVSPSSLGSGASLILSGPSSATATVDSSGNYMFTGVSKGTYTLTPSKSGYTFSPLTRSVVVKGTDVTVSGFTATQNQVTDSITADAGVWRDQPAAQATITSPSFSTRSTNELLLAFIATGYKAGNDATVKSVSGAGLSWVLAERTDGQHGASEIWRAFATTPLSNVTVTANLSQKVTASMTVMSFTGVDTTGTNGSGAIGATAGNSGKSGAPTAKLVTTRNNSWVFGVGNDVGGATARTAAAGQTVLHQYFAPIGDTYWVQSQTSPTAVSGSKTTINDLAPTTDMFNLTIVEILPALKAPAGGAHLGTATIGSEAGGQSTSADAGTQAPVFYLANIATGEAGNVCSPGGLASILGSGLGVPAAQKVNSYPLPVKLAGIQVKVNGIAAPLLFRSDSQINFQCPVLTPGTPLTITLEGAAGVLSTPILTEMQPAAPGLFTVGGTKQGVILIANTNEIAMETNEAIPSRPAKPGEFLTIYTSGLGESSEDVVPGDPAPSNRQILLKNKVTIVVAGVELVPDFAGLAPGTAGLYQINVQLPADETPGDNVLLYLNVRSSDGSVRQSNLVNLVIQAANPQL
jgi:uncharacterized protein (TIGR03437 family)